MGVFDDAAADLHADEDLAVAASFRRPPYAFAAVRVILSQPTDEFGTAIAGTLEADIAAASLADDPGPGCELAIGATTYTVVKARRDAEAASWRLTLSEPVSE